MFQTVVQQGFQEMARGFTFLHVIYCCL